MPNENEQKKERSKISIRIGDAQVELEGTNENIKKLMGKELINFTRGLQETRKQLPSSTEITPKITPKTPEATPREKPMPPPSKPSTITPKENSAKSPPTSAIGKVTKKFGKKMSRNAAIALVLVLVLLASLVSVIAIYVPMVNDLNSQIAEKDDMIGSLNSQVVAVQSVLNQLTVNLTSKDNQIADLTSQLNSIASEYNSVISDKNAIIALGKSVYLLSGNPVSQEQNSSTVIWDETLQYAGYITVEVQSTSNTTYAEVAYASYGVEYYHNVTLGESGGAGFPILPGEVLIGIGNTDIDVGEFVNATVTVNYIY
jgi:uncharacterized coiled-coil protein SlyX